MNEKNLKNEIKEYKKINSRNDKIIICLSIVLVFVIIVMIYVRFFS